MASRKVPSLCHHRGKEYGYVTVNGKPKYFSDAGKWPAHLKNPPPAVADAYEAFRAEWVAAREPAPPTPVSARPTLNEVWFAYRQHCEQYYRKNGRPTSEVHAIRTACRIAAKLYGDEDASAFDLPKLKAVRAKMVQLGWARESINKQVSRVRGLFKWAAGEGLVPARVAVELRELSPLLKGRTPARETKKVRPAKDDRIEAVLPFMPEALANLVRAHRLIGCRPEEIVCMRPCDLERGEDGPWRYSPPEFKTEHLTDESDRLVYWLGPQVQELLTPLLAKCPDATSWVFSTRGLRGDGVHRRGRYSTPSYRQAVRRAVEKAFPPPGELARKPKETAKKRHARLNDSQRRALNDHFRLVGFTPNQIRHARLTEVRARFGIEGAQAFAGHKEITTTQIYARRSEDLARRIASDMG